MFGIACVNCCIKKYKLTPDEKLEDEIFSLCENIYKSGKTDMQCGAKRIKALMYAEKKEYEKSKELINAMPSYLCGRELLIAEAQNGEKKQECYANIINMLEAKVDYYRQKINDL